MITRIRSEIGEDLKVIATGGLCNVVAPLTEIFSFIEPDLTLYGLN